MSTPNHLRLYTGDGSTIADRGGVLPPLTDAPWSVDPGGYVAEEGLRDAVNVAIALGQPLLVTGEPGTGKTRLAGSIAHAFGLPAPLEFHTKSTSAARDLFYRYDALRHFHDAQFRESPPPIDQYIEYEALGVAILLTTDPASADAYLPESLRGRGPLRSVVLIDEIDKAPRDLPNDVLDEIESMSFTVRETGRTFRADPRHKPIVVLTSNSEKTLPDAFLRRCVFYHLSFPDHARLNEIVQRRLGPTRLSADRIDAAIAHFEEIRALGLRKKPSTAELLAWLRVLDMLDIDVAAARQERRDLLAVTYSVLAKSSEDLALVSDRLH